MTIFKKSSQSTLVSRLPLQLPFFPHPAHQRSRCMICPNIRSRRLREAGESRMLCQMLTLSSLFAVMNKCKGATWGGKISGARCSNPRVQQVTPAASLSRTLQNAPLPTQGIPLTGAPAHGLAEFPCGRSLSSP
jgi:hypothetical protein